MPTPVLIYLFSKSLEEAAAQDEAAQNDRLYGRGTRRRNDVRIYFQKKILFSILGFRIFKKVWGFTNFDSFNKILFYFCF